MPDLEITDSSSILTDALKEELSLEIKNGDGEFVDYSISDADMRSSIAFGISLLIETDKTTDEVHAQIWA